MDRRDDEFLAIAKANIQLALALGDLLEHERVAARKLWALLWETDPQVVRHGIASVIRHLERGSAVVAKSSPAAVVDPPGIHGSRRDPE